MIPISRIRFTLIVLMLLAVLSGCGALCRTGDQPVIDATGRTYASACR